MTINMNILKTIFGLGALCVAYGAGAQAVGGYKAASVAGTYVPLDAPTVIYDGSADGATLGEAIDKVCFTPGGELTQEATCAAFNIGFDLPVAGEMKTTFLVSGAGYVLFGNGDINANPSMTSWIFSYEGDYSLVGLVSQRGAASTADTRISYQLTGSGDAAELVVQYENFCVKNAFWGDGASVDYQIRFAKNGGVKMVFNNFGNFITADNPEPSNPSFLCGVRSGNDYISCHGVVNEDLSTSVNDNSPLIVPCTMSDGYTLMLDAPQPCSAPDSQPGDFTLEATSTSVEGSYVSTTGADHYLVVFTAKADVDWTPSDGKIYAQGEVDGDVTVAYYGQDLEFMTEDVVGNTEYTFYAYAAQAFGLDGPKYNTIDPATAKTATMPDAPQCEVAASTATGFTAKLTANSAGDDIVVMVNTYASRISTGDRGYFLAPEGDCTVGYSVPVPDDFEEMPGFGTPENAGTVVYVGKGGDEIAISGLDPSTLYYIAAYSRNAGGECSTNPVFTTAFTSIQAPYEGNFSNYPRYQMAPGWQGSRSDAANGVFEMRDEVLVDYQTGAPSRGTQVMQFSSKITQGKASGSTAWLITPVIEVNERHLIANFSYSMIESANRFTSNPFNDWADDDCLELLVSTDGGQTWESLTKYEKGTNPRQEELTSYVNIEADLNEYRGSEVYLKLQWLTHTTASFGAQIFIDRLTIKQGSFPEIPEVKVGDITDATALVSWKSSQTDYELAWKEADANEETTVKVYGQSSYTLEGLQPLTRYTVRVRGILADGENNSEWSDMVEFTTLDRPAVDAPSGLTSDTGKFISDGIVSLAWETSEEMESYEVAYRESSSTEWIYARSTEPTATLTGLKFSTRYIWKVRAFCTYDRETEFSAQASFTTPDEPAGILTIEAESACDIDLYTLTGIKVDVSKAVPGLYILRRGAETQKVVLK